MNLKSLLFGQFESNVTLETTVASEKVTELALRNNINPYLIILIIFIIISAFLTGLCCWGILVVYKQNKQKKKSNITVKYLDNSVDKPNIMPEIKLIDIDIAEPISSISKTTKKTKISQEPTRKSSRIKNQPFRF